MEVPGFDLSQSKSTKVLSQLILLSIHEVPFFKRLSTYSLINTLV